MKIKRILPILLLLSLCIGLLSGCDLVSADESPFESQTNPPATEAASNDDGVFTITDHEGIGELYEKVLRGELVFDCFDDEPFPSERSGLYVSEYVLNVMQRLKTIEVEPISYEEILEGVYLEDSAWIEGCTIDKRLTLGISIYEKGYIAVTIGGPKMSGGAGYFRSKQDLTELKKEIDSFWANESKNIFRGIGDNGKVGSEWRKLMAEGSIDDPHLFGKRVYGSELPSNKRFSLDENAVEQKKALLEILRTLDNYVEKEITDICECEQCEEITQKRTGTFLLQMKTINGYAYYGIKLNIYEDAIEIYSSETKETAYFQLQDGAGVTIRSLIIEAIE